MKNKTFFDELFSVVVVTLNYIHILFKTLNPLGALHPIDSH